MPRGCRAVIAESELDGVRALARLIERGAHAFGWQVALVNPFQTPLTHSNIFIGESSGNVYPLEQVWIMFVPRKWSGRGNDPTIDQDGVGRVVLEGLNRAQGYCS